ncbi:MAG: serpin family protein [Agathobacter sp.]|nr:serpin family protein [Agathobacter sp.]
MKKKLYSKLMAYVLTCLMILPLAACGGAGSGSGKIKSNNLMNDISGSEIVIDNEYSPTEYEQQKMTDFAVRLFQNSIEEGKNTSISPMSVMVALSMTANGAKNNTLAQMEEVLGLSSDELDVYLYHYMKKLPQGDKYKYQLANSIWFTNDERFTVKDSFLRVNQAYYQADIYKSAFDNTTLDDINLWVEQKTDGMIKNILDEIPKEAIMYLINALVFEAEWLDTYDEGQVRKGTFTTEDGEEQSVEMMYSDESLYLENEQGTGFIKYYNGQKYAFVALLPNEGVTVSEYVAGLSGEEIRTLLDNPKQIHVNAAIPQFETEYDVLMNDVLIKMGMKDAFHSWDADFTGLGTSTAGNIFISRVIHKTYITVGPQGTKAGAATVVEMKDECAPFYEESKTVYLDRPFVYMLIDCENNQPFFIGTYMSGAGECGLE